MGLRRKSRELFIQCYYALSYTDTDAHLLHLDYLSKYKEILDNLADEGDIEHENVIYSFAEQLLKNIIPKIDDIDELIKANLGEYKIEKVGILEVIILRMAIFEMVYDKTPAAVVINEAVELTKKYCAEKSPALVNAILDKIREKGEPV